MTADKSESKTKKILARFVYPSVPYSIFLFALPLAARRNSHFRKKNIKK